MSDEQRELLSRLAKRTYRALYMSGFARMDFRLRSDGRIFLLEANANPNLSKGEDLADSAKAVGMSYTALVNRIVQLGLALHARVAHVRALASSRAARSV